METTTVNINDIKLSSEYLRLETDTDSLQKSIEKVGLINPVTINKENELLAGARRYQAVKALGWEEIPVHVVDRELLQQELISIDENLVRKPLDKLEFEKCLNRGREIFEELNPTANKIDITVKELTSQEKKAEKELEEADQDSFAAVTAAKTGLSKSVIKGAIKRDALASDQVKQARSLGTLNASQTNEIIKLDKNVQDEILPIIADKTVKEARKIIDAAKHNGVEAAVEESETMIPLPKEYANIRNLSKRMNKDLSRILIEELGYEGNEKSKIDKELIKLKENLDTYFRMMNASSSYNNTTELSYELEQSEDEPSTNHEGFQPEYMDNSDQMSESTL